MKQQEFYIQEEELFDQYVTIAETTNKEKAIQECINIAKRNHETGFYYRVLSSEGNVVFVY